MTPLAVRGGDPWLDDKTENNRDILVRTGHIHMLKRFCLRSRYYFFFLIVLKTMNAGASTNRGVTGDITA